MNTEMLRNVKKTKILNSKHMHPIMSIRTQSGEQVSYALVSIPKNCLSWSRAQFSSTGSVL